MRITFVLPFIVLTGGIKAPMELGNRLVAMGHDVTFAYPRRSLYPPNEWWRGLRGWLRSLKAEGRYWASRIGLCRSVPWFDLHARLIRLPDLTEDKIPSSDVVIVTDWRSAERMGTFRSLPGRPVYYIQGYETPAGPEDRVSATWRLPMTKVVISSWLKRLAQEQLHQEVYGPVVHGVDHQQFYPDRPVGLRGRRVGMIYHDLPVKGIADGLAAFNEARRHFPDLQLVMYGTHRPTAGLPRDVEYHVRPSPSELRQLYSACDVWLNPSRMDGGPMHPQEAMACGCAVVSTDVGAVRDYAIPGETALVSAPGDVPALATNLIRLLSDDAERTRIARAGREYIQQFTWERAARQLLEIIQS